MSKVRCWSYIESKVALKVFLVSPELNLLQKLQNELRFCQVNSSLISSQITGSDADTKKPTLNDPIDWKWPQNELVPPKPELIVVTQRPKKDSGSDLGITKLEAGAIPDLGISLLTAQDSGTHTPQAVDKPRSAKRPGNTTPDSTNDYQATKNQNLEIKLDVAETQPVVQLAIPNSRVVTSNAVTPQSGFPLPSGFPSGQNTSFTYQALSAIQTVDLEVLLLGSAVNLDPVEEELGPSLETSNAHQEPAPSDQMVGPQPTDLALATVTTEGGEPVTEQKNEALLATDAQKPEETTTQLPLHTSGPTTGLAS